jgi:hypothetical protein
MHVAGGDHDVVRRQQSVEVKTRAGTGKETLPMGRPKTALCESLHSSDISARQAAAQGLCNASCIIFSISLTFYVVVLLHRYVQSTFLPFLLACESRK